MKNLTTFEAIAAIAKRKATLRPELISRKAEKERLEADYAIAFDEWTVMARLYERLDKKEALLKLQFQEETALRIKTAKKSKPSHQLKQPKSPKDATSAALAALEALPPEIRAALIKSFSAE